MKIEGLNTHKEKRKKKQSKNKIEGPKIRVYGIELLVKAKLKSKSEMIH